MQTATAISPFTGTVFTRTSKNRNYTHALVSYEQASTVRERAIKAAEYNELQGRISRASAEYRRSGKIDPVLNTKVSSSSYNQDRAGVRTELDKLRYDAREGSTWNPTAEQYDTWATGYELSAAKYAKIAAGELPIVNNETCTFHQSYLNAHKAAVEGRVGQIVETTITKGRK
jgi:hypothetical protein